MTINQLSLDQFLDLLPWSRAVRSKLETLAEQGNITALSAHESRIGDVTAKAWPEVPDAWPPNTIALWFNPAAPAQPQPEPEPEREPEPEPEPTRREPQPVATDRRRPWQGEGPSLTMQAVALVETERITAKAAALRLGLNPSAVTRALANRRSKPICPCCKQTLSRGYTIDESVLKDPGRR